MVIDARCADGLVIEHVVLTLAEMVGNGGLIGVPVVKVQTDELVAAKLGLCVVFINAWGLDVFSIEVINVIFTDGVLHFFHFIGMHHDGHTDVLVGDAVADRAGVGGFANGRCG